MSWTIKGNGTGEDLLYSQAGTPSLDLRFAATKSLNDYVSGNNLITFTRSSSGTFVDSAGVLQTAATDVPRFDHNPTTGESLGLLVEEQRTNLLLQSEDFSTTWSVDGLSSIATNTIASPASTLTADTLTVSGGGANRVSQSYFVPSAGTYTLSVYAKAGTGNVLQFRQFLANKDAYVLFNFTTGVMGVVSGGNSASATATATALPNGWYRLVLTNTYSDAATIDLRIGGAVGSSEINTTFYLWGAQLEAGAFPTSYIPTTTSTVTRSADVASITGSNFSSWYRQDEGTVFADAKNYPHPVTGKALVPLAFSDNTYNNRITLAGSTGNNQFNFDAVSAGFFQRAILGNFVSSGLKASGGYKSTGSAGSLDGAATVTSNTPNIPSVIGRLDIGQPHDGNNALNGCISRLTYWPVRLGNNVLQQITQ